LVVLLHQRVHFGGIAVEERGQLGTVSIAHKVGTLVLKGDLVVEQDGTNHSQKGKTALGALGLHTGCGILTGSNSLVDGGTEKEVGGDRLEGYGSSARVFGFVTEWEVGHQSFSNRVIVILLETMVVVLILADEKLEKKGRSENGLGDSAARKVEVSGVSVLSDSLGFEGLHTGAGIFVEPSDPVTADRIVHVDDVLGAAV